VLAATFCFLDTKATIHSKFHFLLYSFVTAMNPRMLLTVRARC
jgi:hypothetical protein